MRVFDRLGQGVVREVFIDRGQAEVHHLGCPAGNQHVAELAVAVGSACSKA